MGQNKVYNDPGDTALARKYFEEGQSELITGHWEAAADLLSKAISLDSSKFIYYSSKAYALHELEKDREALWHINKAIKMAPKVYPIYNLRGDIRFSLQQYENAKDDYTKALYNAQPGEEILEIEEYVKIGACYRLLGDYNNALLYTSSALKKDSGDASVYTELGYDYYLLKEYGKAIYYLSKYETMGGNTEMEKVLYIKGLSYYYLRHDQEAVQCFLRSRGVRPLPEINSCIAAAYKGLGQYSKAQDFYQESISKNPNILDAYTGYANLELQIGNCSKSKELYLQYFNLKGQSQLNANDYVNYGHILGCLKDTTNALESFAKGVDQDPDNQKVRYERLSFLYGNFRYFDVQINDLDHLIKNETGKPNESFFQGMKARLYLISNDTGQVRIIQDLAISSAKSDSMLAVAMYNKAVYIFYHTPFDALNRQQVFNYLNQAITLYPQLSEAYCLLAFGYYRSKQDHTAVDVLKKATPLLKATGHYKSSASEIKVFKKILHRNAQIDDVMKKFGRDNIIPTFILRPANPM